MIPRSIAERMVFVDTSAFLAVIARNDQHHSQASQILQGLGRQRVQLFTTVYVIYESHAGVLSTVGENEARKFLRVMENSTTDIYVPTADDEKRAREIVYNYQDKDYSLCDATSFALMQRFGTNLAFSFDDHFRQHGFSIPLGRTSWP